MPMEAFIGPYTVGSITIPHQGVRKLCLIKRRNAAADDGVTVQVKGFLHRFRQHFGRKQTSHGADIEASGVDLIGKTLL